MEHIISGFKWFIGGLSIIFKFFMDYYSAAFNGFPKVIIQIFSGEYGVILGLIGAIIFTAMIKYMESTLSKYSGGEVEYEKYISGFIGVLKKELLELHIGFEEKEVFPLFPNDPRVEEFRREHEVMRQLINKLTKGNLGILVELIELCRSHFREENRYLIPKINKMIEDFD